MKVILSLVLLVPVHARLDKVALCVDNTLHVTKTNTNIFDKFVWKRFANIYRSVYSLRCNWNDENNSRMNYGGR